MPRAFTPEELGRLESLDPRIRDLTRRSRVVRAHVAGYVRGEQSLKQALRGAWLDLLEAYAFLTDHSGHAVGPRPDVQGLTALVTDMEPDLNPPPPGELTADD